MKTIITKLNLNEEFKRYFDNSNIINATFYKDEEILNLTLQVDNTLPFEVYNNFLIQLKLHLRVTVNLTIKSHHNGLDYFNIAKYFDHFVTGGNLPSLLRRQLGDGETSLIIYADDVHTQQIMANDIKKLQELFAQVGIKRSIISEVISINDVEKSITVEKQEVTKEQEIELSKPVQRSYTGYKDYQQIPLKHLNEEAFNVIAQGQIFDVDVRVFATGTGFAVTYYIHDGESAIIIKRIYNTKDSSVKDVLKKGTFVKFYGDYVHESSRYFQGHYMKYRRYEITEELFERKDTALTKRVEFHTHTKISEMDGVTDVKDYLNQAFAWKHPGIVITDHEGVQSYPKAHDHVMKLKKQNPDHDFKIGYGVEMNLVDKDLKVITNPKGQHIHTANYVVFDIETTGLSAFYDHIIEFGAVKIENGQTVESYQTFIKPPISIPKHIEKLTNISDADVVNAKPIAEQLDKILDFIGDSILVAHNASFDIDFLDEILRKHGRPPLDNTVIDTLNLARVLYENRRSYRLGSVARLLKITYDDAVAHRADYDAELLSNVFFQMKRSEQLIDLETVDEIQVLCKDGFSKNRRSHLSVIAKNQTGLKSLYQLISLSYTTYLSASGKSTSGNEFVAEPRIIKDEIMKRRENLLIGAGCTNSDIFEIAMNKGEAALDAAISFYDFIEIMPLSVYKPLLDRQVLTSEEDVIRIIKRIIEAAKRQNKLILATGNVHYNHPKEKIIRDVYVHSLGIGGTRHPLYLYDESKRLNTEKPDQHFRTTDEMLLEYPYLSEEETYQYVVKNPTDLLDSMEEVIPVKQELFTPKLENSDKLLKDLVYQTATDIYGMPLPAIVEDRIEFELKSILGHGFGVIYYISHLLVKKSLDDGYLVGSRGSVGSSFVATMSKITEVNPLAPHYVCPSCKHHEFFTQGEYSSGFDLPAKQCPKCNAEYLRDGQDIPFETFLGFEGDKVPDIDLNFSGIYQEIAHAYTKEIFGEDSVFKAGTISTVADKTAYGYVAGYYESINQTIDNQAWHSYLASSAAGVKRTTGQHPGGIIVIPDYMDVHDFTPYQFPANNINSKWLTTHFEYHDIESNVLKLDILGHVDPTAMKMLEKVSGIDINTVPINDPDTISIFASPDALSIDTRSYKEKTGALGIPEFGTPFVRRMLEATKPESFSDLVRISGLSHGTGVWNTNAEELIKNGLTLRDVIGCRDDIMVYLMHHGLEPKMAFDIMESVRRGRGLNDLWIKEMNTNNIPAWYIDSCQKIEYMFPKAHAVAYVMMAVRVAWFKVHNPIAYYAVYFTLRVNAYEIETMTAGMEKIQSRMHGIKTRLSDWQLQREVSNKEKSLIDTLEVTLEMNLRGYKISPIDLYLSEATEFIVDPNNPKAIIPPFNVVDGLGDAVARSIVEARKDREFMSKQDLISRTAVSGSMVKKLDELNITSSMTDTNQMSLF
ncbi:MAG: PolC-type DNA polymerase III [Erysipelothrix sp.]|nr:PolC-type DNA polymerase III [Erysipelothrix sp.]